jgi:hypothetical protein
MADQGLQNGFMTLLERHQKIVFKVAQRHEILGDTPGDCDRWKRVRRHERSGWLPEEWR